MVLQPNGGLPADLLRDPTAQGAKRIFLRFLLVAVVLSTLVGAAVVAYNVYDALRDTRAELRYLAHMHAAIARQLRRLNSGSDVEVVRSAVKLLNAPMALLDRRGRVVYASDPQISRWLPQVYGGGPSSGLRVQIRDELAQLSGAWLRSSFTPQHDLLVVIARSPADEGLAVYMTVGAGMTGLGIVGSLLIMLAAANWMLRRPLSRLVDQLTGALARDVQRRREAERQAVAAYEEAERHLAFMNRLIDASAAVGIVALDAQGLIQIFNGAAVRILGYPASEVVGKKTFEELRRVEPVQQPRQMLQLAQPREGEMLWADRQGNPVLLFMSMSDIVGSESQPPGKLVTFIDVTERRRLEQELQLNELKLIQSSKLATLGEMATGIAHELNQPLNNIGLLASRVQRRLAGQQLPAGEQEFCADKLDKIADQVQRAGQIIDHLRTFGRPRAKQLSSVDVRRPIEGVMVFLREQLVRHAIEVIIDLAPDLPAVEADEARLEQVLMNLILNARDALDEVERDTNKRIEIVGRAVRREDGEPAVSLQVRDNGPGMLPEVQERVFEPFFTTKEVGRGTGLGLSISYGLIREFGGTLEVTSQWGAGATFTVMLHASAGQG